MLFLSKVDIIIYIIKIKKNTVLIK